MQILRLMNGDIRVGDTLEVTVGRWVPGGHALGFAGGRTLFIRHGIPGEQVRVRITEVSRKVIRADVTSVLVASKDRVQPPCEIAGVCGGCDFQHIALAEQRQLKSAVLSDALRRQGGMPDYPSVPVEPVPGDDHGLRWRTRVSWQIGQDGERGFFRHRSHEVVPVRDCLICRTDAAQEPGPFRQVHIGAPATLTEAVIDLGRPEPGEQWWDLFGGSGLFADALAGAGAQVDLVDSDDAAIGAARRVARPGVYPHCAPVLEWIRGRTGVDGVVIDPPRAGLGEQLVAQVTQSRPRIIVSVSCDPVTFARDLRYFGERGYEPTRIRAFDAFPMTQHMEIVAALVRGKSPID